MVSIKNQDNHLNITKMAKEAYYFSHDSNARNDQKLIQVRIKLKWEGYGLYWALIEMLRDAPDYKLPANYNVIAYDLRTDNAIVKSLINDYGLFVISDDYFYSESLCDRMKMRSEKGRTAATKRWDDARALQTHSERNTDAMHSDANKGKESKGKEKKGKESKGNNRNYVSSDFKEVFEKWLSYKADRKQSYKSEDSIKDCYENLYAISGGDPKIAEQIVKQSTSNNWAGLFALKNSNNGQHANNFNERQASLVKLHELSGNVLQNIELNDNYPGT